MFDNETEIMNLNISLIKHLEEMAKNQTDRSDIECKFFESASDVLYPRDLSLEKKNLMVFDDLLLQRQNKCEVITREAAILMSTSSFSTSPR